MKRPDIFAEELIASIGFENYVRRTCGTRAANQLNR